MPTLQAVIKDSQELDRLRKLWRERDLNSTDLRDRWLRLRIPSMTDLRGPVYLTNGRVAWETRGQIGYLWLYGYYKPWPGWFVVLASELGQSWKKGPMGEMRYEDRSRASGF